MILMAQGPNRAARRAGIMKRGKKEKRVGLQAKKVPSGGEDVVASLPEMTEEEQKAMTEPMREEKQPQEEPGPQKLTSEEQIVVLIQLNRDILEGLKTDVKPRIEAIEQTLDKLPEQLTSSFARQGDLLKAYVDEQVHPKDAGSTAAVKTGESKGLMNDLFDMLRGEVDRAGGLGNLFRGTGTPAPMVDVEREISEFTKVSTLQERLELRDWLKHKTLKGPALPPGALPSATHP